MLLKRTIRYLESHELDVLAYLKYTYISDPETWGVILSVLLSEIAFNLKIYSNLIGSYVYAFMIYIGKNFVLDWKHTNIAFVINMIMDVYYNIADYFISAPCIFL